MAELQIRTPWTVPGMRISRLLAKILVQFIPICYYTRVPVSSQPCQHQVVVANQFRFCKSTGLKWNLTRILSFHFPILVRVSICHNWIYKLLPLSIVYSCSLPIFHWVVCLFLIDLCDFFQTLDTCIWSLRGVANMYSQSMVCLFICF